MKSLVKILVVDDDPNLRKTLTDILRLKGYETVTTGKGSEAIAATHQNQFALALIDLMLPDMAGLDVMARIKAISPLTEAIILTGHASLDTAIEATGQGAFSYLIKPYKMDELLETIRHGVEHQQALEKIVRLASFPRLDPNPIIEMDPTGEVTYTNPAAERLFPDLVQRGTAHPLLAGVAGLIASLREGRRETEAVQEVEIGAATYELHISYVPDVDLVRLYVLEITRRKLDEREIHLLATTDNLTGLANRREFSKVLAAELERAKRYGAPMSLIMYDLDFFKRVNDTLGHDAGDEVLQGVAAMVKKNIRSVDVAARWGGEEFMVLMPHSDIQAAVNTAEKLRLAISRHCFEKAGCLTASFGVVTFEPGDDLNSLLKRVDVALYQAKGKGRNCVETVAGPQ